jgi:hypothetical protein
MGFLLGMGICYLAMTFNPDVEDAKPRHKKIRPDRAHFEELKLPKLNPPDSVNAVGGSTQ